MKQLLEDYQRRLKTIKEELSKPKGYESHIRLTTKASCYRTFISELKKQISHSEDMSYYEQDFD